MLSMRFRCVVTFLSLTIGFSCDFVSAKPPPTDSGTTHPSPFDQAAERQLYADLDSGDAARVSAACDVVRAALLKKRHGINGSGALNHMLARRLYAQVVAETDSEVLAAHADSYGTVASLLKTRVKALSGLKQPKEALAAAKLYYYMVGMNQTKDAINEVAMCLAAAYPDDRGIVRRFKEEQLSGTTTQPAATQQSALGATRPVDSGNATGGTPVLPVLASIQIDPKPYEAAIAAAPTETLQDYWIKGNLLLLAGRGKEARDVFQQEYDQSDGDQLAKATENVARAVRDKAGCVAPANAYILSLREKAK